MSRYRLCGIQIETGESPRQNIEKLTAIFREAVKVKPDFVIFPEMFEIVTKPEDVLSYAHSIPSEITDTIAGLAKENSVNIIGGSFFEKEGNSVYNTSLVYNRRGELCGKYRKIHLFDAFGYGESRVLSKGKEPLLCELDGLKFGVAICNPTLCRFPCYFLPYGTKETILIVVFCYCSKDNTHDSPLCPNPVPIGVHIQNQRPVFVRHCNNTPTVDCHRAYRRA